MTAWLMPANLKIMLFLNHTIFALITHRQGSSSSRDDLFRETERGGGTGGNISMYVYNIDKIIYTTIQQNYTVTTYIP
jgi:hypothetical protein